MTSLDEKSKSLLLPGSEWGGGGLERGECGYKQLLHKFLNKRHPTEKNFGTCFSYIVVLEYSLEGTV